MIRGSAGCNLSSIPDSLRVDVGQKLRPVDSFGRLDSLETSVSSHTRQGGREQILSHEARGMVMDASSLCEFWSPPQFGVGGWAFGWGVGGDEVGDLGKVVVEL